MKRSLLASIAAFAAALAAVTQTPAPPAFAAAPATSSSPSAAAAAAAAAAGKKDPCGTTKSKWQHLQCENYNNSAPGDEYFGRMKISYLGIDNTFRDGSISAGAYTTDNRVIAKLNFADEALARWAAKYPGDPQLARSYYLGFIVFRKVYTPQGQQIAWNYLQILAKKYPSTYFGKTAKATIAGGYTEHWFGLPQPCPTPLPPGVMPDNAPTATATPSPKPGTPIVDIIAQPCIPAPTPQPTDTPTPKPKTHQ